MLRPPETAALPGTNRAVRLDAPPIAAIPPRVALGDRPMADDPALGPRTQVAAIVRGGHLASGIDRHFAASIDQLAEIATDVRPIAPGIEAGDKGPRIEGAPAGDHQHGQATHGSSDAGPDPEIPSRGYPPEGICHPEAPWVTSRARISYPRKDLTSRARQVTQDG